MPGGSEVPELYVPHHELVSGSLIKATMTVTPPGLVMVAEADEMALAAVMVAQILTLWPVVIEVGEVVAAVMEGRVPPGKPGAP